MENSNFVEDLELTAYINEGIAELHDLLVATFSDYYVESFSFITVNGTTQYDLPDDFYKLRGVDVKVGADEYKPLKPFNFNERNKVRSALRYKLLGSQLKLTPKPSGSTDILVWYVPTAPVLVNDADAYADLNSYSEFVILSATIKMKIKEESDATTEIALKDRIQKRIEGMAKDRDVDQSESVTDVYASDDDGEC